MEAYWMNGKVTINVLERVWMKNVVFQKRSKTNRILG
jgi:hypothetical protein